MVKSVHLLRKESVALSILRNALLPQLLSEELTLSGAEGLVGESV